MEPKSAGENSSNNVEAGTSSIPNDKSGSSSASSASVASATSTEVSSQNPNDIDRNEQGSFNLDHEQSKKGLPKVETSASSTLEFPLVQMMERDPQSSEYRIPSHVFASNNPSTPNKDWSIASNESLFELHNMSFTREEFNLFLKSGELGMYGDMLKSGELGNMCRSGELPPPLKEALKSWKDQMPTTPRNDVHKSGEQVTTVDIAIKNDDLKSEVTNIKGAEPSMDELPCPATVSRDTEAYAPSFASQVVGKSERHSSVSLRPEQSERSSSVSLRTSEIDKPKKDDSLFDADRKEQSQQSQSKKLEETSSSSSSWLCCC